MSHCSKHAFLNRRLSLLSTWSKLIGSVQVPTTSKDNGNSSHLLSQKVSLPFLHSSPNRTAAASVLAQLKLVGASAERTPSSCRFHQHPFNPTSVTPSTKPSQSRWLLAFCGPLPKLGVTARSHNYLELIKETLDNLISYSYL